MIHKSFQRKTLMDGVAASTAPILLKTEGFRGKNYDCGKMIDKVSFYHVPNEEEK